MWLRVVVSVAVLALEACCLRSFPPGFQFGAATAAYQIEGAWNVSDKSEGIWDHLVHTRPDFISDRSNGDVACDSYHLWEEDLKLIKDMGLDYYRFSISWPRLLPTGFPNHISAYGCAYYSALIAGLRARGIAPVVTLYHWDLPQSLQDLGGWANPLVVDWFADYARVVFSLYGDQVSTWLTLNEPCFVCDGGYRDLSAPGINNHEIAALQCTKNVLLAHATVYRIYEKEFKPKYGGEVSIANQEFWFEPESDSDLEITLLAREYAFGRYSYPIFSATGGWPPTLEEYMKEKSKKEGWPRSRLPAFTPEEISFIKGSFDFYALNHYTSRTVRAAKPREKLSPYIFQGIEELGVVLGTRQHWGTGKSEWLKVNPAGLYNNLQMLRQSYGDIRILITENGYSDDGGSFNDTERISYMHDYLEQVLLAIENGVNVVGYTAWSLMDNFEWSSGYGPRFGLYAVDFSDPQRRRTPRASAEYYKYIVAARSLDIENVIVP